MKRIVICLLTLVLVFSFPGCRNDASEKNEVMHYLTDYYWYYEAGGYYNMVERYEFNRDGSYKSTIFELGYPHNVYEGTYKINTNNNTITFKSDSAEYEWTYSLYSDGMKLINSNSHEYKSIAK